MPKRKQPDSYRKDEYIPKYRRTIDLEQLINDAFTIQDDRDLSVLLSRLNEPLSIELCTFLLRQLVLVTKRRDLSPALEARFSQLTSIAFANVNQLLLESPQEFELWAKHKPPIQIVYILHNLGKLCATPGLTALNIRNFQYLIDVYLSVATPKAEEISLLLTALCSLEKENKLKDYFPAAWLEHLLMQVVSLRDLKSKHIGNCFYTLGLLAENKKLNGQVPIATINVLLSRLAELPDANLLSFCTTYYGLGLLAKSDKLEESVSATVLESSLARAAVYYEDGSKGIANGIYGIGILAKTGKIKGCFCATTIISLLNEFLSFKSVDAHSVSSICHGLGSLVKAGKLNGKIPAATLNALLHKALPLPFISQGLSNILFAVATVVSAQQFEGKISADLIQNLLRIASSLPDLDFKGISNGFYALAVLANVQQLPGSMPVSLVQTLLNKAIPHIDKPGISSLMISLSKLAKSKYLSGPLDAGIITTFVRKFNDFKPSCKEAYLVLTALTTLVSEKKLSAASIPISQLQQLVRSSLATAYLHPREAAELINSLVVFKGYAKEFNREFLALIKDLSPNALHLPKRLQDKLTENINELTAHPEWQHALMRCLQLPIPAVVTRPPQCKEAIIAKSVDKGPKASIAKKHGSTSLPPRSQPARTPLDEVWTISCKHNPIFNAIAHRDMRLLKKLLNLPEHSLPSFGRAQASTSSNSRSRSFFDKRPSLQACPANELVTEFFTNIGAEAFRQLVSNSTHVYFQLLLEACTQHTRYQLAQTNALHPVLLYLPMVELTLLIEKLISPLQMYRDSPALLHIIDALTIRITQNPYELEAIRNIQKQLIDRGLTFHQETHHHNVVSLLKVIALKIHRRTTLLLDKELEHRDVPHEAQGEATQVDEPLPLQSSQVNEIRPASRVNAMYQYEAEDLNVILNERVRNCPNVFVLAASLMNDEAEGNRVADVLRLFLEESDYNRDPSQAYSLLLPIVIGEHWIGIKLTLRQDVVEDITYYNSLRKESDAELIEMIRSELLEAGLITPALPVNMARNNLIQTDTTSCGPCLIEDFYGDLVQRWWTQPGEEGNRAVIEAIRLRHLALLRERQPDFHDDFYHRQRSNIVTVTSITQQQRTHGIVTERGPGFFASTVTTSTSSSSHRPDSSRISNTATVMPNTATSSRTQ